MKALNRVWALAASVAVPFFISAADAAPAPCANPNALGVARTVEIDTTGGPGFGFEHYKANDFLQQKEVVLTFDDGPQKYSTEAVLAALAEHCTKATFFSIGKMALGYPEIIREVVKQGHTVGTHTWSHQSLGKLKTFEEGRDEIERGNSAVRRAVGGPIAPFFRFPTLKDTPESLAHLGKRNIAMFSTDIDSFDFKPQPAENIVKTLINKLEKNGKGIVLMHDIHKTTAKAVPLLLKALKDKGYKIVHMKGKGELKTLAEYDALIEKDAKGLPQIASDRPVSSIVKTIEGEAPANEAAAQAPAPSASAESKAAAVTAEPEAKPEAKVSEAKPAADAAPAPAAPAVEAAAPAKPEGTEADGMQAAAPASPAAAAPATTGSISNDPPAVPAAADANDTAAEVPASSAKSWSARAVEIWEMWFGK